MAMKPNAYEKEVDNISKRYPLMAFIRAAALLIRTLESAISYNDAKKFIKYYIKGLYDEFDSEHQEERDVLYNLALKMLTNVREIQQENHALESFMLNSSPIVRYSEHITRDRELSPSEEACKIIVQAKTQNELLQHLHKILMENIVDILKGYELIEIIDHNEDDLKILTISNILNNQEVNIPPIVKYYYGLAMVTDCGPWKETLIEFLSLVDNIYKGECPDTIEDFRDIVEKMGKIILFDAGVESYDLFETEVQDSNAVNTILSTTTTEPNIDTPQKVKEETDQPKYDITALYNFNTNKRMFTFSDAANRFFVSSVERAKIINYNYISENRYYYEMDNDTIVCPAINVATYGVVIIVLHANTNKIEVLSDFKGKY
jgi:SHS2 domain-containing protein